jgi:hypothetical protein
MEIRKHARLARSVVAAGGVAFVLAILLAVPAFAASDLNTVIDSVGDWVAGLLIALATLFLTLQMVWRRSLSAVNDSSLSTRANWAR